MGTGVCGGAIRKNGSPGGVVCSPGHGAGPGEGFLCDVDPGGLYEEHETTSHAPFVLGWPKGTLVDGSHQIAPV